MQAREIRADHRVRLFSALLQLNDKQGPWDQTLQLLNQGQRAARQAQLQDLVDEFERGQQSLQSQLKETGQFLPWELALIELGLATGNINAIFKRLREHYLLQQQFYQEFKRQLKWPLLVMVTLLVAVLVWACIDKDVGLIGAGVRLLISLGGVYLVGWIIWDICLRYRAGLLPAWLLIIRKVPGVGEFIYSGQAYHYLKNLQLCTDSGLALQQSLKLSAKKIPDAFYQPSFMAVHKAVSEGQKLSVALSRCGILNGVTLKPVKVGDTSAADAQQMISEAAFQRYVEQLWYWARWLPLLLYALLPFIALVNLLTI